MRRFSFEFVLAHTVARRRRSTAAQGHTGGVGGHRHAANAASPEPWSGRRRCCDGRTSVAVPILGAAGRIPVGMDLRAPGGAEVRSWRIDVGS